MTTTTNDIQPTGGLLRAFARRLFLLLLLLTAGAGGAWADTVTKNYKAVAGEKTGATEMAMSELKITYGAGSWASTASAFSSEGTSYTQHVLINGGAAMQGSSVVTFTSGTAPAIPDNGAYIVLEPLHDGTIYLDYLENYLETDYCVLEVSGSTIENYTFIAHDETQGKNQTHTFTAKAGKKYYFLGCNGSSGVTIKVYGVTFKYEKVDKEWDFTSDSFSLSYTAVSKKYHGFNCKLLAGNGEGLALQNNDKWSTSSAGLTNSGSGQRGIIVMGLLKGEHVKIDYTTSGDYTDFTTYDGKSILESNTSGSRVYQMTANGDLELWIARSSHITKITIIRCYYVDAETTVEKNKTITPYFVNPSERAITYTSSNTAVATVNSSTGEITGVRGGKTTVTATSADGYTSSIVVNVVPFDFGWASTEPVTVSLLDADNNNHVDDLIPEFINTNGLEVTYSSTGDNVAWFASSERETPWGATLYGKPRIKGYNGTVTLTATDPQNYSSSFTLTVTDPGLTTGTYNSASNTYEFNTTGRLTAGATISNVPGLTMQYGNSGDLPVVVRSGGMTVVKMIDVNGFSHPNLSSGTHIIPTDGTYYVFTTTKAGMLTVTGVFSTPKLYRREDETEIVLRGAGNTRSAILESGKTYYLYNKDSNQPLLHSFRYVDLAETLTFRNSEPIITVDIESGSYSNPATSSAGLPISYSCSGPATVSQEGVVTFNSGLYESSTVVVTATDGTETVSYVLQLAKRTWVFNDASKWTTTASSLTGGGWETNGGAGYTYTTNGLSGDAFCRNTIGMDYSQLTTNGSTLLPETRGLLFSKAANNDRLYIAPSGFSKNFLAMRATFIGIDDVQAGQVVTVNWTGGNSSATLDISDAAGENVTASKGGTLQFTVTQTGRVTIVSNPIVSYINSITVSTPTRAIGTLTYAKTVVATGNTEKLTGYTITDEAGTTDLKSAYSTPSNYMSSNKAVATVDESGKITAVSTGTAVITATATALNSVTHQASVTLVALVEVVSDVDIRIRTIDVDELRYVVGTYGVNAGDGLDRRIPGFDLKFTGDDGVKCNNASSLLLRHGTGKITIEPRVVGEYTVTITQALVTVKSVTDSPTWKINGGKAQSVSTGGISLTGLTGNTLTLESVSGSIEITDIKLYYRCSIPGKADDCLDETKVAPILSFAESHVMRVPADGRAFSQVPTASGDYFSSFNAAYTYASSAPATATIATDGTNGQLLASGQSTITATCHETAYFAQATTSYTVSNTLLPGESYGGISMAAGQFIHVYASATELNTPLTLSGSSAGLRQTTLRYNYNQERCNTSTENATTVTLTNDNEDRNITVYRVNVVTASLLAWLYYEGQDENFREQVQFKGFSTGSVAGYRVLDIGDPDNPIDLTDAYVPKTGTYTYTEDGVLNDFVGSTGGGTASAVGTSTVSLVLKKNGEAEGYDDNVTATATVNVLDFGSNSPVTWNFVNAGITSENLGQGWTYDDRGFQYGNFSEYMPILVKDGSTQPALNGYHGVMLDNEFRWYPDRGLRVNLSQIKSGFKFPVKKGMEIDVYAASSSADITHKIANVTDISGNPTTSLYISVAGEGNPVHNYFLAEADGCVEVKSRDKVGMYLKSITLKVPEIHFQDEVVTVLNKAESTVENLAVNLPDDLPEGSLKYTITAAASFDSDGNETPLESGSYNTIATVDASGVVTLTGSEGWVDVHVTNVHTPKASLEPEQGTYRLYAIDFRFAPAKYDDTDATTIENTKELMLDVYAGGGEAAYSTLPKGYNKVATAVNYSCVLNNGARARLSQYTNANPRLTTYSLTAYGKGNDSKDQIVLTAKTGRIEATCLLTVADQGMLFGDIAPVLSAADISSSSTYTQALPTGFTSGNTTVVAHKAGKATFDACTIVDRDVTLTGLSGYGAIRVIAKDNNGTDSDTSDDKTATFVLTLAYPASEKQKWDFYRQDGLQLQTNHGNKIDDYLGTHLNEQTKSSYVITGGTASEPWTTTTTWNKIYRNGDKEPRWAYSKSVKCDNAFIVEETAGLQIETAPNSFYVDNNATASYIHIGIHSRATITIPKLKQGDLVSLNLSRVIPNNGAIIKATNVTDLAGTPVTESFTITRSQIDYQENGQLATDGEGKRIIPGYYTFITQADGDVSFTLADEGYLDVLSIEIYSPGGRQESDNGYDTGYDPENGYDYTMLPVKLSTSGYPDAPEVLLKESEQQRVYGLSYCHPLWSTSVGPCLYVPRGTTADGVTDNLDAVIENDEWFSAGGAGYVDGRITVNEGYGKVTLRMENYTADNKYLIGYTPDYTLTVGMKPHQNYPYTWNFTNISGGEVQDKSNNAYLNMVDDPVTWTNLGYNLFELNTETKNGSYYVPDATLVTASHNLGVKGTRAELNTADEGCDEFNGLGFSGGFTLRSYTTESEKEITASAALSYSYNMQNLYNASDKGAVQNVDNGGTIKFGATSKLESSSYSTCGYTYKLDGSVSATGTKYVRLQLPRPLQNGDVITIEGYAANVSDGSKYGYSFYAVNSSNQPSTTALTSIYLPEGAAYTKMSVSHTVTKGDGLSGHTDLFIFRASTTLFFNSISITGAAVNYSAYQGQQLYAGASGVSITIPDLNADGKQDWIYIKADAEPTVSNAAKVTDNVSGGADAAAGVYKYKVLSKGNCVATFAAGAEISRIGVTHILKPISEVGSEGWATESRDCAIDHSLTGVFTQNDVNAYTVSVASSNQQGATVQLDAVNSDPSDPDVDDDTERNANYGVPANTGVVLKLDATTNLSKANSGGVPLFVPAMTTPVVSYADIKFNGNSGNMMKENLTEKTFTAETETVDGTSYTAFILAQQYIRWTKKTQQEDDGDAVEKTTHTEAFQQAVPTPAAVFYRLHLFGSSEPSEYTDAGITSKTADELNTLGANKAYLLLPTADLPKALWDTSSGARRYVAILGVSDMEEELGDDGSLVRRAADNRTYDLRGRVVDADNLRPGVYIRGGRKIVVR